MNLDGWGVGVGDVVREEIFISVTGYIIHYSLNCNNKQQVMSNVQHTSDA